MTKMDIFIIPVHTIIQEEQKCKGVYTVSDQKIRKLVFTALMAALVCVATMVIQVPSPTGGYVNAGDCFVLLSGWLLGPWYGAVAGGLGTALTDIIMGYTVYAPASLLIKGVSALMAAVTVKRFGTGHGALLLGGLVAELWMTCGYLAFTSLLLGKGAGALLSVPGNLVQGAVGIILSYILMQLLQRRHMLDKLKDRGV